MQSLKTPGIRHSVTRRSLSGAGQVSLLRPLLIVEAKGYRLRRSRPANLGRSLVPSIALPISFLSRINSRNTPNHSRTVDASTAYQQRLLPQQHRNAGFL
jgi:hypothetical protein